MDQSLKWVRPSNVPYPNIWMTFEERDINSEKLVEYRIQDLPESMFPDAIQHMVKYYLHDEPVAVAYNGVSDPDHVNDYIRIWHAILTQKTVLVCLKSDSNEIVGLNFNYVLSECDTFNADLKKFIKSEITHDLVKIFDIIYKDFDVFKKYKISEILTSFGLSVAREYRGRRIGQCLLETRKIFCETFDLKATSTAFSSDYSNNIADKVGFKTEVYYSFDEIAEINPTLKVKHVRSSGITTKTWVF